MHRNVLRLVASSLIASCHHVYAIQGLSSEHMNYNRQMLDAPVDCQQHFYKTDVAMTSAIPAAQLQCTAEEIQTLGLLMSSYFDALILVDKRLAQTAVVLDTTFCPTTASSKKRHLKQEVRRDVSISANSVYSWEGGGFAWVCPGTQNGWQAAGEKIPYTYEVLDFSINSAGDPIEPNTYVKKQWRKSHGLSIRVILRNGGYAPLQMARLLDSANPGKSSHLGSPNANCPGGGPGIGSGGNPGQPGRNCAAQGNVLVVQESDTNGAKDNPGGGVIIFSFASDTHIGHIGLMSIVGKTANIRVLTFDGKNVIIPVEGRGYNSVQQVHIGHVVKSLRVVLDCPGAVTEIGVFRASNGTEAAISYRSGRSYTHNVSLFAEYSPYFELYLTDLLTAKVGQLFGALQGGCWEGQSIAFDVAIEEVSSLAPVLAELKCDAVQNTVWSACPTKMESAILEYDCTPDLKCPFTPSSSGENYECNCGSDRQFYCSLQLVDVSGTSPAASPVRLDSPVPSSTPARQPSPKPSGKPSSSPSKKPTLPLKEAPSLAPASRTPSSTLSQELSTRPSAPSMEEAIALRTPPITGAPAGSEPSRTSDSSPSLPTAYHHCTEYFYETRIEMWSEEDLQCTPTEIAAIGKLINTAYDEVLALDNALSDITISLETTVCPGGTSTSAQRYLQHERPRMLLSPTRKPTRKPTTRPTKKPTKKPTAKRKLAVVSWKGGGLCNLCSADNTDRRLPEEHEHRALFRQDAYEVIDFSVTGAGNILNPNTYVKGNWRGTYGLLVQAIPFEGGYAPNGMARILDSANPGNETRHLGSPNAKCAVGGPGVGSGGVPGEKGENCVPQGNVLIIQESNATVAKDSRGGGILLFSFDSITRIGHIGLMGVANGTASVEIAFDDFRSITIPVEGLGTNSVQQVDIGYAIRTLSVTLSGPGAVTEIGIFTPRTAAEAISYRGDQPYTNNVTLFDEFVPYLEFDLSYYLTRKVNNLFGSAKGGCLSENWAEIDVTLEKVSALPTVAELKCGAMNGTIWTECPTDFVAKILQYECTPGLECLFESTIVGEYAECNCGSDQQFYCSKFAADTGVDSSPASSPASSPTRAPTIAP